MDRKKVSVIGLGYIGLPTAALLATKGYFVKGIDVSEHAVKLINQGQVHIVENDLDLLVKSAVNSGNLTAFLQPQPADVFILAVPTPFKDDHVPDLAYVEAATRSIAPLLQPGNLVILESTSPVGTTDKISEWLRELRPDLNVPLTDLGAPSDSDKGEQIYIAHCPERVLPGQVIRELVENDRIIGGIGKKSGEKAREFYATFVTGSLLVTKAKTAEMAKLTENAFRDVNIAFANELANISKKIDVDVSELISLANRHPRVNILNPGPGVGGHCIAVDPWFIVDSARDDAMLIRTARVVNDDRPRRVVQEVLEASKQFEQAKVACFGLSYKPNIDDLRESPAVEVVKQLIEAGVDVCIVEPYTTKLPQKIASILPQMAGAEQTDSCDILVEQDQAFEHADIIVGLVGHDQFKDQTIDSKKIVIDTVGIWK